MMRTVITPSENKCTIFLPDEYIGRKIEISFHALDEHIDEDRRNVAFKKYRGIFKFDAKKQEDFDHYLADIRNEWE